MSVMLTACGGDTTTTGSYNTSNITNASTVTNIDGSTTTTTTYTDGSVKTTTIAPVFNNISSSK